MRTERHYLAMVDTGHDYINIEYDSCYRANSKGNLEDCKKTMKRRYNRMYRIMSTQLWNIY